MPGSHSKLFCNLKYSTQTFFFLPYFSGCGCTEGQCGKDMSFIQLEYILQYQEGFLGGLTLIWAYVSARIWYLRLQYRSTHKHLEDHGRQKMYVSVCKSSLIVTCLKPLYRSCLLVLGVYLTWPFYPIISFIPQYLR